MKHEDEDEDRWEPFNGDGDDDQGHYASVHPMATDSAAGHVSIVLLTPLRHGMDVGGTEFTVFQTKVSVGLPIISPLHLLHNQNRGASTHVLTLTSNTYPAYL